MKPIVIYDDKCKVCTAFGHQGRNMIALGYSTSRAKKLMRAQFGKDYGFVLMLFTSEKVYWGSTATSEIVRLGYSSFLQSIFKGIIPAAHRATVTILNVIYRRKTLPHPPKFHSKKLPESGSMELTKKAKYEFSKIAQTI